MKTADEPKFLGFAPGKVVSLKYADVVRCEEVVCDALGEVVEVRCKVLSKEEAEKAVERMERKLGSVHWLAGETLGAKPREGEVRLYERLFSVKNPAGEKDWRKAINEKSEIIVKNAMMESVLFDKKVEDHVQFERLGYFSVDKDSTNHHIVWNRTCALK